MSRIRDIVNSEFENIETVLNEIKKVKDRENKETVILVGLGAFLQNFYNGIENILKQLLLYNKVTISNSPNWHKDLLNLSIEKKIISKKTANKIGKYLYFRHFCAHNYGFLIEEEKLMSLVENVFDVFIAFQKDIIRFLKKNKI